MEVQISWESKAVAWSLGYCESCQQTEAIRCEDTSESVSLFFIPVSKAVVKRRGFCHYCNRPATKFLTDKILPISDWNPRVGQPTLAALLGINEFHPSLRASPDQRCHSLLRELESRISFSRLNIRAGLFFGASVGAIAGGYGTALLQNWGPQAGPVNLDTAALMGLVFGVIGFLFGGLLHYWIARRHIAIKALNRVCIEYGIRPDQFASIASSYSQPIQRAIRQCRDQLSTVAISSIS